MSTLLVSSTINGCYDYWLPRSHIDAGGTGTGLLQTTQAWGVAFNVNDGYQCLTVKEKLSTSKTAGTAHVTEDGEGLAVAYTMGSMKNARYMNEVSDNNGTAGSNDEMTEIAVSLAF